ncbi:MAG: insulinase family protein [Acidobacteriia bacterium]|nr:insulinase family protein [Terriglobia bacterium]
MFPAMRRLLAATLLSLLLITGAFAQVAKTDQPPKFFPYAVQTKTLPSGLIILVIPTPEFKDMVTYSTAVFAGSGKETEKGKTGLAHLFEHIMFRHEYGGKPGGYDEAIRRMGVHNNAWTDYDLTFYHPTTFSQNLIGPIPRPGGPVPGLIELESSRFKNLTLDRKTFEVEAGAVLGEYRRVFSDPAEKMVEDFSPVAFPNHPYGHTVIGYRDDVENMPNAWDSAWEFYHNYYAPNGVAVIAVGDVDPATIFAEAEKRYADWKPSHLPQIPAEQAPDGPKQVHVKWEADVSPQLIVGYHTPAMKPGSKETAVTQILGELLASRSAPLFQKLRYQKQTVTSFGVAGGTEFLEATDPHLLLLDSEMILERFRKDGNKYVDDVQNDVISGVEDLKQFSQQPKAAETLRVIKSKVRNDFLANLDSTGSIAQAFAWYYRFDRDPRAIDSLMQAIDSLTPKDVDAYAANYFTPQRRIVTTLWHDQDSAAGAQEAK